MTRPSSLADLASIFDSQPISGMRNRIINGNFEVWQRGSTSRAHGEAGVYSADRWTRAGYQAAGHARQSVTSPVSGLNSRYAIRASSSTTGEQAAGTRIDTSQKIENVNCYDLAGQTVTVSFWARFSTATISSSTATAYGNFTCFLQFNTSTTDSSFTTDIGDSSTTAVTVVNGSLPTTWTKYTGTLTVPASTNNISVRFQFSGLGSTASAGTAWYDITEIQLEPGPFATPFERRSFGQELQLCQRYYQTSSVMPNTYVGQYANGPNTFYGDFVSFFTLMRTTPTSSYTDQTGGAAYWVIVGSTAFSADTAANITTDVNSSGWRMRQTRTAGNSTPAAGGMYVFEAGFTIRASAEL